MKILTVLGARPQFIKAATVSRALSKYTNIEEIIVHTGQHFDTKMSDIFFNELDIPRPQYNLNISGLSHGAMTGRMIEGIENIFQKEKPDWVLVYGDTNSTLAGALAASKLHIPIAHVEAGLRSNNPMMPEEVNRVLTDRLSYFLFCPTQTAVNNLKKEGFPFISTIKNNKSYLQNIFFTGDVMLDAAIYYRDIALKHISLDDFSLNHQKYALCTLHRQENTDDPSRLNNILGSLRKIAKDITVVLPLHPRTKYKIEQQCNKDALSGILILEPLSYLEMQRMQMSAKVILTDSGGLQKEAYFNKVPCITLRDETEWLETVEAGWNQLVGADRDLILNAWRKDISPSDQQKDIFGVGDASKNIIQMIMEF